MKGKPRHFPIKDPMKRRRPINALPDLSIQRPTTLPPQANVTFTLTSTNRLDLLKITLDSFLKFNRYPIAKYIVIEDSGVEEAANGIRSQWPFMEVIFNNPRLGQTASLDLMYSKVETEYIFHCEDDWEFVEYDFIDKSMDILAKPGNEKIIQVWPRGEFDTNMHPVLRDVRYRAKDTEYYLMSADYYLGHYGGFGFQPGLRRLRDWQLIGSYSSASEGITEAAISKKYIALGFKAATLIPKYMNHIGAGRHTDRDGLI